MVKYPSLVEYRRAISKPNVAFAHQDFLARGKIFSDARGIPEMSSGGFACVARIQSDPENLWVLRMFTKPQTHLKERYKSVNDLLPKNWLLEAYFIEDGIRIIGYEESVPIVVIRFTDGLTLRKFLVDACVRSDTKLIEKLHQSFFYMGSEVKLSGLVHGDLSPDNLIVTDNHEMQIRLIDYDNCWHPNCGQLTSNVGESALQAPKKSLIMDASYDDFSFALYNAVLGLLAIEPKWGIDDDFYEQQLIVSQVDLANPETSAILSRIKTLLPNSYNEILDLYTSCL